MTSSSNLILQHYIKLTEFLGKALGPDYEVALHDLTRKDRSIIAIANNYISGREVGAPLTNMSLGILRDKSYERMDYHLHYYSINVNGKDLRSSTFFIKDNGKLIGLLCINFDDSRYRAISDHILKLCHPDLFVTDVLAQPLPENEDDVSARSSPEKFRNFADAVALDAINRELERMGNAWPPHPQRAAPGHHFSGIRRHFSVERRHQKRRGRPRLLHRQHLPLSLPDQPL